MGLLDEIYNQFDPSPLAADSQVYVDCREVRGDRDIWVELGKKIQRSDQRTCQLYTGHRGGGKSTELRRLQRELERRGSFVVYFEADANDVQIEDVEYTDILLACTRHLLAQLRSADPQPVLSWLRDRWQALKEILQTQISIETMSAEVQIQQIVKLTGSIRTQPSMRRRIREQLNPHTEDLIDALNVFIADAKHNLPEGQNKLVVIADSLEKITPIQRENGRNNHEEVYIDRSQQLQALDCHIIYTVPISLVLSQRASDLMEIGFVA
jgi:hypothetical protein